MAPRPSRVYRWWPRDRSGSRQDAKDRRYRARWARRGSWVQAGANVKVVQQMLGHASAAMTLDVYAGLFADNLDEVADRLDQAFTNLNADQVRTTCARSAVTPLVERRRNAAG